MSLSDKVKAVSVFLLVGGLFCLPVGWGTGHPKWGDNLLVVATSLGGLLWAGIGLMLIGSIALFVSSRIND